MPEPSSRRHLLRTAAILGGVSAVTSAAGVRAAPRPHGPTFVLVHGANGNAASFAPLVAALARAGHRALAVDLPGHGPDGNFPVSYQAPQDLAALAAAPSPTLARTTLAHNVRHVVDTVRRVARHGPVVLVGHSMGGATITRVGNEVPELIGRLVYLSAFCCVRLRSVVDCFQTPQAATTLLPMIPAMRAPERLGVSRTNWRSADPAFLAAAKAALAADYDDASFRAALNTFEPDESAAVPTDDARGAPATWGRIPRAYVRYTRDRAIPLALQDRMIEEADRATPGNRFDVRSLEAPHLGPKDPRPLAAVLTGLL
ncbi:alpha/beta hydrolase [Actinomadura kijaniata]|uniref:Pimeloyl-ACP methyl ester carboxylesterase n=1 Tax=Actinomadura namibiensis TaxID=182080 RepID=A0A7W3LLX2_ACTNM|nr:alpha/beta hydrolase family protein [Actinomadura namibiensis]MBA8950445.1 pimeloyl-ACP methyl ester carboxylesterase [Actinomadura namibiensis]